LRFLTAAVHGRTHEFYRIDDPFEYRFPDEEMPDIELDHLRERGNRFCARIVETMTGMDFQAEFMRPFRACADALPFRRGNFALALAERLAPRPHMNFHDRRTQFCRRFNLVRVSGNKQRNPNTRVVQFGDKRRQMIVLASGIKPAFGRTLGAFLRHQTDCVRICRQRDAQHFICCRHFEVERLVDFRLQARDVIVADMTAVLSQVRRNPVASGRDRKLGSAHGIRMTAATGVTNGGNVIDIDAKAKPVHALAVDPFGFRHHRFRAQLSEDRGEMLEVVHLKINRDVGKIGCPSRHANVVDISVMLGNDLCDLRE